MNPFTTTNLILLSVGLIILVLSVIVSGIRLSRGTGRAGILNVILALAACAVIGFGLVRIAFPVLFATPGQFQRPAPAVASADNSSANTDNQSNTQTGANAQTSANTQSSDPQSGSAPTVPARLQTAIASGRIPAAVQTQIAEGTLPSFGGGGGGNGGGGGGGRSGTASANGTGSQQTGGSGGTGSGNGGGGGQQSANASGTPRQGGRRTTGTPSASGNNVIPTGNSTRSGGAGGTGGNTSSTGGNSGGGGTGGGTGGSSQTGGLGAAFANVQSTNQTLILITLVGAILVTLAGWLLYRRERKSETFEASYSSGLLYTGAGVFVLVAALLIPVLPGQIFGVGRARAAGPAPLAANVVLQVRNVGGTATPSDTPTATLTATELPTLTPMPSDSPTALFTAAAANSGTATSTAATSCMLVAQAPLNLRSDPSTKNEAIGKVFAGSLLTVTGQSTDKQWWRVINDDLGTSVEGWVSNQYVTVQPGCVTDSVPVIGPSLTLTSTTRPTRTPFVPATARPAAAGRVTQPNAATASAFSCTVITSAVASLRPDPSKQHPPIAQVPESVGLTAMARSADHGWFFVNYTEGGSTKSGWIGAGAVVAASACYGLPLETVTPTPADSGASAATATPADSATPAATAAPTEAATSAAS